MYTLGYSFRPWTRPKAIADGPSILEYVEDTAREFGIDKHIRYGLRVERASWSTEHLAVDRRGPARSCLRARCGEFTCGFLFGARATTTTSRATPPTSPAASASRARVVHPQQWPDDIDYDGKRVVVIGSGATAVTLVPELAKRAAHVTMLQRTPTYVVNGPRKDPVAEALRGQASLSARPTPSCARRTCSAGWLLRHVPALPRQGEEAASWARSRRSSGPKARSTSPRATSPGTSACASCPTATSSRPCAAGGVGGDRPHRHLHREGPAPRRSGASSRPTSWSPPRGSSSSSSAARRSRSTASEVVPSETLVYRG
jgi:cation diffusion facilitator CzcD-associated flavoprotein CzcO